MQDYSFSFETYCDNDYLDYIRCFRIEFKYLDHVIGHLLGKINHKSGNACISELFVAKEHRRNGIATQMLKRCLKRFGKDFDFELLACPFSNESFVTSEILKKFYEKFDFDCVCVSQETEIEIAYIMKRKKNAFDFEDDWIFV